jgi:hypothetical protein
MGKPFAPQERVLTDPKRALVESTMFRYQTRMGPTLRARTLSAQQSEARTACSVIHRMAHSAGR